MSEKEYIFVGNAQLKTRDYIKQLERDNRDKDKEIERRNNIINELEKWLVESIEKHTEDYLDWKYDKNVYLAGSEKLQNVFDKLQELKGSAVN